MEMTEYHRRTMEAKKTSIAYWKEHPLKPEEYLEQFKRLRAQRIARESKYTV